MTAKSSIGMWGMVFVTACLISGNLVGAGILGLPIDTGLAGFVPSLIAMFAGGGLMFLSAVILGNQAVLNKGKAAFDYPSLYEKFLGRVGKWVAIGANMVILYGLLTAYFTGGAEVLASLVGSQSDNRVVFFVFSAFLIVLTCLNLKFLQKLNTLFIVCLVCSFGGLVFMGAEHVEVSRLNYTDWMFLPATLPIIVTAFHFHNIIPTVITDLNYDTAVFKKSVFVGMLLAFCMNLVWIVVGIGAIPLTGDHSILSAFDASLPATVSLESQIPGKAFVFFASFFSLVAISTSFLANGVGLLGFIRDLLKNTFNTDSQPLTVALTFAPPFLTACFYPDIFLKALDIVGGFGIVILFCILPFLIMVIDKSRTRAFRVLCSLALVFAVCILALETLQKTGVFTLKPAVAHGSVQQPLKRS